MNLLDRLSLALAHFFSNPLVARDRAAHLIELLQMESLPIWEEAQATLDVRKDYRRFGASDLDRDAALVGALREFVVATWSCAPSGLDIFAALKQLGVPLHLITQREGAVA